jgi:hypothetical protein
LDPRFTGSNLADGDGFLRAIEFHCMPSFRGEVKPLAPCHKILHGILKSPTEYDRDTTLAKFILANLLLCY